MLKPFYAKLEDIPEKYRDLYTERNGRFELTKIEGLKTEADVQRVQDALQKERNDHKETKDKFAPIAHLEVADVVTKMDGYEALKLKADGVTDDKIEGLVTARLNQELNPLKRQNEELTTKYKEASEAKQILENRDKTRSIHDHVRKAALEQKVVTTALDDILLISEQLFEVTADNRVITKQSAGSTLSGLTPDVWLTENQKARPHWWPAVASGGATGSGGGSSTNPFSKEHWNLTEQGKAYKEDPAKAQQLAKAAGVQIGATSPK